MNLELWDLCSLRQQKMYTQKELALKLGVHLRTIQGWESGETPISDKRISDLAEVLGVSVKTLIQIKYKKYFLDEKNYENVKLDKSDLISVLNKISKSLAIIAEKI